MLQVARFCLAASLLTHAGLAQPVSFGVKAGVPVSPESHSGPDICAPSSTGQICGNNYLAPKPYAIGPAIEVFLPWRFSLEADALYRRFHYDISNAFSIRPVANNGKRAGLAANAWLFPLLLKYSPADWRARPFLEAGATLRHLGDFNGQGTTLVVFERSPLQSVHIETGRGVDVAVTAGAGVRYRMGFLDISPEIRYLHWTSPFYQPVRNEAMLTLGLTFPARR